jgi:hypothetical protein
MPEAHEQIEHAEHIEHAGGVNKKIALVIAIMALFLAFSEVLGKSAQTEAMNLNIKASDLWNFFQAKNIRRTVVLTAAEAKKAEATAAAEVQAREPIAKLAQYHNYELASAAFQIGIVLCSAAVITGMVILAWLAGGVAVIGIGLIGLGLFAPHLLHLG